MNLDKLKTKIPQAILPALSDAMDKFQINTPLRAAHFLAQAMHESGNLKKVEENLNYSADGLTKTFYRHFFDKKTKKPTADVMAYARKPQKIASRVYANRMGNGDEASGEGWKFRGRGYIQLTGKNNYLEFGKAIGENLIANPDVVASPKYAALSAAWFFSRNGCNAVADKGATDKVVADVTKIVNGGAIGLKERQENFKMLFKLLTT